MSKRPSKGGRVESLAFSQAASSQISPSLHSIFVGGISVKTLPSCTSPRIRKPWASCGKDPRCSIQRFPGSLGFFFTPCPSGPSDPSDSSPVALNFKRTRQGPASWRSHGSPSTDSRPYLLHLKKYKHPSPLEGHHGSNLFARCPDLPPF